MLKRAIMLALLLCVAGCASAPRTEYVARINLATYGYGWGTCVLWKTGDLNYAGYTSSQVGSVCLVTLYLSKPTFGSEDNWILTINAPPPYTGKVIGRKGDSKPLGSYYLSKKYEPISKEVIAIVK